MPTFSAISQGRLATCDWRIITVARIVIQRIDFVVLEGHRDKLAQNKAFDEGKSKLEWPNGKHNRLPSKAIDVWPYFPGGAGVIWKDVIAQGRLIGYWQRVAEDNNLKFRYGLDWDGDFMTAGVSDPNEAFLDAPHIEIVEEDQE